ncbi:hypothetical protein [Streptomyces niveus]
MGEKVIDENKEEMDDLTDTEKYAVYTAGEVYTETPVEDFVSRHKEEIDKLDARTEASLVEDQHLSRLVGYQDGNLRARVQGASPRPDLCVWCCRGQRMVVSGRMGMNRTRDKGSECARVRRLLTAVGVVLALGAGGVACGSGEEEHPQFVGADEVCGGLFAGPPAEMLEKVTGKTVFAWANGNGMEKVVAALKEGYASGRSWAGGALLCEPDPKGGGLGDEAGISFSMYAPQDVKDERLPAGGELYTMGLQSSVRRGGASLYFECVSPQLDGSDKTPLRIQSGFGRGKSDAPDTREYRNMNMQILHAMTLKVVKELDCENNAGLPKIPVLTPK